MFSFVHRVCVVCVLEIDIIVHATNNNTGKVSVQIMIQQCSGLRRPRAVADSEPASLEGLQVYVGRRVVPALLLLLVVMARSVRLLSVVVGVCAKFLLEQTYRGQAFRTRSIVLVLALILDHCFKEDMQQHRAAHARFSLLVKA